MVGFLSSLIGRWSEDTSFEAHPERCPSFSDFSAECARDFESELHPGLVVEEESEPSKEPAQDPWRSVFTPGKNYNMAKVGASYYDNVKDAKTSPGVWDQIVRAENLKRASFQALDTDNSGFITASNLREVFGKDAQVEKVIQQADQSGNGMINFQEFSDLLRHSHD